jgi:hypothetical protein
MQIDPLFAPLLAGYRLEQMDSDPSTIYGMWRDGRLGYTNTGWQHFAEANGGADKILKDWSLGRNVRSAWPPPLRDFYTTRFEEVVERQTPWEHRYQCSSALVEREVQMRAVPLGKHGVLVVNTLVREVALAKGLSPANLNAYNPVGGLVTQCAHCRRFRRFGEQRRWDWIPEWVEQPPPSVSHGLCEVCLGHYYAPADGPTR